MKNGEIDAHIEALVAGISHGRSRDLLRDMIQTVVQMGTERMSVADLKFLKRALGEMRYSANIFSKYHGVRKVAVFGSSRTPPEAEEFVIAREFASRIVQNDFMVITGGGDGIMGAAQEGAGAEKSFGLNIRLPFEQRANPVIDGDPKLINFNYFFTRKLNFVKETHAFVALPGGFGTHDETFEVITLMQTGKMSVVPIVLLDRPGGQYWEEWRHFVNNDMLDKGLISASDFNLIHFTHDVDDAVREIVKFYRNFHSYRWVRDRMVIRIDRRLTEAAIEKLNLEFDSILAADRIMQTSELPEEKDSPHLSHLHRIVLIPHKRDFGAVRLLLNAINEAETE